MVHVTRLMSVRLLPAVMALVILVTSTVATSVSYACRMDGQVHGSCCCVDNSSPTDAASVERAPRCCELRVGNVEHAPALLAEVHRQSAPIWMTWWATPSTVKPLVMADATQPRRARGPPLVAALPLFVKHCTFLI